MGKNEAPYEEDPSKKFILFRLGDDLFGAPILSVKEVVEYQKPKALPLSQTRIEGVINIRGEVVGVFDLRKVFGFKCVDPQNQLLFDSDGGLVAANVDKVEAVVELDKFESKDQKNIQSLRHAKFLLGVGHFQGGLIQIIDLLEILGRHEVEQLDHLEIPEQS